MASASRATEIDRRKRAEEAARAAQRWARWEISNFEYLMTLNTLAGACFTELLWGGMWVYTLPLGYEDLTQVHGLRCIWTMRCGPWQGGRSLPKKLLLPSTSFESRSLWPVGG